MEWSKAEVSIKLTEEEKAILREACDIIDYVYQGLWVDNCEDCWDCDVTYAREHCDGTTTYDTMKDKLDFRGAFGVIEILSQAEKLKIYL